MSSITETSTEVKFSPHGYPLRPSGRMYTRAEIVSDASIPLPTFVDAANPPRYWQRQSQDEQAAEAKRIASKKQRNTAARERRQATHSSKHLMDNRIAFATLELVERVNEKKAGSSWGGEIETFVAETAPIDPLTPDPDEADGPRDMAESIMDLLGQDYKAARKTATRIAVPSAEQAQRGLEVALGAGGGSKLNSHRWQFGRGR